MRRSVIFYDIVCIFFVFFSAVAACVLAVTRRADALFCGGLFSVLYWYQLILLAIPALLAEIEALRLVRFLLFCLPPGRKYYLFFQFCFLGYVVFSVWQFGRILSLGWSTGRVIALLTAAVICLFLRGIYYLLRMITLGRLAGNGD
ncbi:MAG: hypothetical protein IJR89_04735 [Clostridia bacterium]|nr:hypothetical protein [Clostridia bacterium]